MSSFALKLILHYLYCTKRNSKQSKSNIFGCCCRELNKLNIYSTLSNSKQFHIPKVVKELNKLKIYEINPALRYKIEKKNVYFAIQIRNSRFYSKYSSLLVMRQKYLSRFASLLKKLFP